MRYLSVCAGIEAATVAWHGLGWQPAAFSEIDAFPRAVLAHHYPDIPLHGDFTTIEAKHYGPVDLLVGGTPCQSFSIAGKRLGLDDARGNLAIEFLRLAVRLRVRWLVWENVPGVLSSNAGRDFSAFLSILGKCGYGFAYRVLDAQYFGVPQRRRRVLLVGYLGDWRPAAAVLLERESLRRDLTPRRAKREETTGTLSARSQAGGGLGTDFECDGGLTAFGGNNSSGPIETATAVNAHGGPHGRLDFESETFVAHTLRADGFDASEDGTGRGIPLVPIAFDCKASGQHGLSVGPIAPTLRSMGHADSHQNGGGQIAVAFNLRGRAGGAMPEKSDLASLRAASGGSSRSYIASSVVRRLTPRECERLQGFPDDYTLVPYRGKPPADGPRYKALGNSMAVPVMRWLGGRIEAVNDILLQQEAA